MSRIFQRTAGAITLDRDGLALSQTPGAAGPLTLTAATTLTPPRRVSIYSGSNIAARVFTIVGTDRSGNAITDTVTGVNASTVSSSKIFGTVTSITVDAATGAAVEAGWTATSITSWIHTANLNHVKLAVLLPTGTTGTFSVEATSENMLRAAAGYEPATIAIIASGSVATSLDMLTPWAAVRLVATAQNGDLVLRAIPTGYRP